MAALLAAASFVPAQAATIPYSTGFENPDGGNGGNFSLGAVNGQNSWTGFGTANIVNTNAQTGTQDLFLGGGGAANLNAFSVTPGLGTVDTRANVEFQGSSTFQFGVGGLGGTIGFAIINPSNGNVTFSNGSSAQLTVGNAPISSLSYNQLDLFANYSTNQYTFAFNNVQYGGAISFLTPNTTFTNFSFSQAAGSGSNIDNVSVSNSAGATPEPSTLVMLGGGLAMLAAGVARRKKA